MTCIGSFTVLLDASIVNVALPTIQAELPANLSGLQWVIDAYTLPLAVLMLTAGTLGDCFGRKRLFLTGLMLFLIGSLRCGLAPALGWLLVGRVVLQGVGAAALLPGSLAVLVAFLLVEARVREPLSPLELFSNSVFSVANVAALLLFFI